MSAAALAHVADTLTSVIEERDTAQRQVAELLERIGLVTGVEVSTKPTAEAVAEALRVLDGLVSPTDEEPGHYWADPIGDASSGLTGPFKTSLEMLADARKHADQLPRGYLAIVVRDGRMLAPLFVPPAKGAN